MMDFANCHRKYAKEIPGADIVFQPSDLYEYDNDAWDIRISLGDAPLEEAFYFTVEDPAADRQTIEYLLDHYALNPDCRDRLDVGEYPDLPYLQEELIQYRLNAQQGLLNLEYYVNFNPIPGPVPLWKRARELMSVCTYHDRSHDYRVLDLVLVPSVPYLDEYRLKEKQKQYGHLFLLMLIEHYTKLGQEAYEQFLQHPGLQAFLGQSGGRRHPALDEGLGLLEQQGWIERDTGGPTVPLFPLMLTEQGIAALQDMQAEVQELADLYDRYDSVSISPPALGIVNGFDVRIQMMEYDGRDCERSVLLCVLDQNRESLFAGEDWDANYEQFGLFHIVQDALAYKTNFTAEVLQALKELGQPGT